MDRAFDVVVLGAGEIAGLVAAGKLDAAEGVAHRRRGMMGFVVALRRACELDPRLRELAKDATLTLAEKEAILRNLVSGLQGALVVAEIASGAKALSSSRSFRHG